ncbi:hypothetical protein HELRODRAFT_144990, partial [Helobdella robusta]|uniref:CRAL-TRIO domain-containing protein n=1 Tax=Helobdella robusta TaxID=6412 RepID=T1EJH9_HELRO
RRWRRSKMGGDECLIDMLAVEPYRMCISHGGYYGDGLNAIIVFAACYLPPRNLPNYVYVMDHLFLYIMNTLELLVTDEYKLIYFHGTLQHSNLPTNAWLKKCYQAIDRNSKFSKKLTYVKSLYDLSRHITTNDVMIPEDVNR